LLNLLAAVFVGAKVVQDEENFFFGVSAEKLQVYLKNEFKQSIVPGVCATYVLGSHVN
jgi:hypothetical protein